MPELLFLASSATLPCGVEMFTRCLFDAWLEMGASAQILPLGIASAKLHKNQVLVLNLPLVAWKKSLLLPLYALFSAKLHGRQTLVILHEWNDLAWQRRAALRCLLPKNCARRWKSLLKTRPS